MCQHPPLQDGKCNQEDPGAAPGTGDCMKVITSVTPAPALTMSVARVDTLAELAAGVHGTERP